MIHKRWYKKIIVHRSLVVWSLFTYFFFLFLLYLRRRFRINAWVESLDLNRLSDWLLRNVCYYPPGYSGPSQSRSIELFFFILVYINRFNSREEWSGGGRPRFFQLLSCFALGANIWKIDVGIDRMEQKIRSWAQKT